MLELLEQAARNYKKGLQYQQRLITEFTIKAPCYPTALPGDGRPQQQHLGNGPLVLLPTAR